MSETRIHFNNQEIAKHDVKKQLDIFFEQNKNLSEPQKEQLYTWATKKIGSLILRKKHDSGTITPEYKDATVNYILGRLEGQVSEAQAYKEREHKERLNPQLVRKYEIFLK